MSSRLLFTHGRRRLAARLLATPQRLFLGADGVQTPEGQVLPFADWCAANAGSAVELVVSAKLLHELVCDPGLPLQRDDALQDYARQQFTHYFGAVAQRWPLALWRAGAQRGASALHGIDWAALQQVAAAHDVDLRSARPAWAPALQRLEPQHGALAWVEGGLLSWVRVQAGEVQALRQQRLAAATQAALDETLRELCAVERVDGAVLTRGYGLADGPARPQLAGFDTPARPRAGLPRPDFLGQRQRRSLLAWPLALTGLLVLATAGWSAWNSHRLRDEARLALSAQQARGSAQRAPRAAAAARPEDADRLRAAAEAQALLRQNWEPLLANVEQAGAGQLNWLALDFNAGRNELRLEGLVQDKAVALALVDRLAAAPGWAQVVLSRFQNAEQGLAGQRFELGATLQTALMQRDLP